MSRRGKNQIDAALDDLGQFMRGRRDFEDGVLWSKDKSPMWQAGYRQAIRAKKRDFGDDMISVRERLLIKRVKPRFFNLQRRVA